MRIVRRKIHCRSLARVDMLPALPAVSMPAFSDREEILWQTKVDSLPGFFRRAIACLAMGEGNYLLHRAGSLATRCPRRFSDLNYVAGNFRF